MKRLILSLSLLFLLNLQTAWAQEEEKQFASGDLVNRGGLWYQEFTSIPTTGIVKDFYPNGQLKRDGKLLNGKPEGLWQEYHPNGQLHIKTTYQDGRPEGSWQEYDSKGILRFKQSYISGLPDGTAQQYDETGQLMVGTVEGETIIDPLSAVTVEADTAAALAATTFGDDDVTKNIGSIENGLVTIVYPSGQLKITGNVADGQKEGLWEEYHPTGHIKQRTYYKQGKIDGSWEEFDEHGQIKIRGTYIADKKEGLWEYYDENGKKLNELNYKNDVPLN